MPYRYIDVDGYRYIGAVLNRALIATSRQLSMEPPGTMVEALATETTSTHTDPALYTSESAFWSSPPEIVDLRKTTGLALSPMCALPSCLPSPVSWSRFGFGTSARVGRDVQLSTGPPCGTAAASSPRPHHPR